MTILTIAGVFLVLVILVHIFFRVIKFTLSVFLLGVALIIVVQLFQSWFGIDLIAVIERHL